MSEVMTDIEKPLILIVDDETENIHVLVNFLSKDYRLIVALSGEQAIEQALLHRPQLVLLDAEMPNMDGYEVCKKLKSQSQTHAIPIIFITANDTLDKETRGFDLGAVDYIYKLAHPSIICRRIATHLSLVEAHELDDLANSAIQMLGEAGHYNDSDTGVHIWRMSAFSVAIAKQIGWLPSELKALSLAAAMHDTGKVGISDEILKAPRALTSEEWVEMKRHTIIGYEILSMSKNKVFQLAASIALNHHEKWNGLGYPNQLSGDDIPQAAQIVAVADVFDALTMDRSYKNAWPIETAVDEIKHLSGSHFSPKIVDAFVKVLPEIKQIKLMWDEKEMASNICNN